MTKRLHCCLLLMSERRTFAYAVCVAACRAMLPDMHDTACHNFSLCQTAWGLISCCVVM